MRIGLIRHYQVNHRQPYFLMTSEQFEDWVCHYDEADIFSMDKNRSNLKWDICFSSDLPRAVWTAEKMAPCPIIETPMLREVPLAPFIHTKWKLPFSLWNLAGRLAWLASHFSQPETKMKTVKRAKKCIDMIEETGKKNILIVSHGFFLYTFVKELEERGYSGNKIRRFKNGKLYIYGKERPH